MFKIFLNHCCMRILFSFLLLCFAHNCFAQDADFTDFRRKNEGFAHVTDKALRGDLASFTIGGLDESIGKGQFKKLPVTDHGNDFITFDSNQIHVTIKSAPFFATKHKLAKEGEHVVKIDGKPYFGNYGKVPSTAIASVSVIVGKDTIDMPQTAWAALYNPQFAYNEAGVLKTRDEVYLSPDKHTFYIYMLNKDDTGSYEVTWVIQDKKYLRRVIDYGFTK
jgi:hypothetical protein